MGTGHFMRCLAIAQAWQDAGGQAVFAVVDGLPAIRQRLLAENMELATLESPAGSEEDANSLAQLARRHAATWVVVDGYQFGAAYQQQVKALGPKLLFRGSGLKSECARGRKPVQGARAPDTAPPRSSLCRAAPRIWLLA
jgi:spore coat polysaccharide biosynthesis predicted glycosyltransferase SpsG